MNTINVAVVRVSVGVTFALAVPVSMSGMVSMFMLMSVLMFEGTAVGLGFEFLKTTVFTICLMSANL